MPKRALHILISPLDWGLGHSSRCVPIIRHLLAQGCKITVACSGLSQELLYKNFGNQVSYVVIPGYEIRYSKNPKFFLPQLLLQVPKVIQKVKNEHRWLKQFCAQHKVDGIISDNRYGLYHAQIPNVILTHQWQVLSDINAFADRVLLKIHQRLLNKFKEVWLVDEQHKSLAGKLSHPRKACLQVPYHYIGHLSQLDSNAFQKQPNKILVLLSGPEPLRTQLLNKIIEQACLLNEYQFTIIAGTNQDLTYSLPDHIEYISLAGAHSIAKHLAECRLVICRSGYSTLMDLMIFHARALLIPTPGQTEQEYLAQRLHQQGVCFTTRQADLNLESMIPEALRYKGFDQSWPTPNQEFQKIVNNWLSQL